jgi:hypothetical protein
VSARTPLARGRPDDRTTPRRWTFSRRATELIKLRGPWRTVEQVEIATLEYVDWFNRRLLGACGDIPSVELEAAHYRQQAALTEAGHP